MAAINFPAPGARRIPLPFSAPRVNWWIFGAIAVLGGGAILPVLQNSTATTRGFEVQDLEAQQAHIQGDMRVLESDVASLTSLSRIESRARELGLTPGVNPIYITVDEPGPAPAKIPAEYLPGPVRISGEPEPWWRSLFSWVSLGN